jgi:uncharacterized protein (DUF2062 family)
MVRSVAMLAGSTRLHRKLMISHNFMSPRVVIGAGLALHAGQDEDRNDLKSLLVCLICAQYTRRSCSERGNRARAFHRILILQTIQKGNLLNLHNDNTPNTNSHRIVERSVKLLKGFYNRFLRIRGTPRQVAMGFALGIFVGMTPFLGFHTVIAVMMASLIKWSKLAAGIGVFITNPFTAPFIYPLTYRLGVSVTGFSNPSLLRKLFESGGLIELLKDSPMIIVDLIVGGVVIGLPLAVIAYLAVLHIVTQARARMKLRKERRKARRMHRMKTQQSKVQSKQPAAASRHSDDGPPSVDKSDRMAV